MNQSRSAFMAILALLAAAPALAQNYPSKPVRMIVPFAPGGVLDGLLRPTASNLGDALGQPVVTENRPGANTGVGTGVCAKGTPDGYTICGSGSAVAFNPILYRGLGYVPEKDLAPVTNMVFLDGPIVVNASLPITNMASLVSYAKANPGKLNFGSFGEGSPGHLYIEWIKNRTGIDVAHISYKGAAPVITALLANEVQLIFMATGAILPHIKAGKARAIVMPAPTRSKFLADVPTFVDEGYDFKPSSWFGLFVTAGTPRPIVQRIYAEVRKILFTQEFRDKILTPQFYEAVGNTPEQFAEFLKSERELAAMLVKISGLKPVD
jgi:tripartite-type tricarboxylate transporter receptor subunit TctC